MRATRIPCIVLPAAYLRAALLSRCYRLAPVPCSTTGTSSHRKGLVGGTCIPDNVAGKKLQELKGFVANWMSPKNVRVKLPGTDARAGMSRPRKSPAEAADEYCENNTTPEKVFGVPLGETLPASPPTDVKDEVCTRTSCLLQCYRTVSLGSDSWGSRQLLYFR